jgi:quinol monooxygenase YgiN
LLRAPADLQNKILGRETMATNDIGVTIVPYFKAHAGKLSEIKGMCEQFVEKSQTEPKCLYYGFSFNGDEMHCREGYADAEGLLTHLENVGALLKQLLSIAELTRLEVHGPTGELEKLRAPLADLNPTYFVLEYGFRR